MKIRKLYSQVGQPVNDKQKFQELLWRNWDDDTTKTTKSLEIRRKIFEEILQNWTETKFLKNETYFTKICLISQRLSDTWLNDSYKIDFQKPNQSSF